MTGYVSPAARLKSATGSTRMDSLTTLLQSPDKQRRHVVAVVSYRDDHEAHLAGLQ